jgi:hypothetical protein
VDVVKSLSERANQRMCPSLNDDITSNVSSFAEGRSGKVGGSSRQRMKGQLGCRRTSRPSVMVECLGVVYMSREDPVLDTEQKLTC